MKTTAALAALIATAALVVAQDNGSDVRTKPIITLDDIGTTSAMFTVTAGSDGAPAGFNFIVAPNNNQPKHVVRFPNDVLQPGQSVDVQIDGLTCGTGYHFGVVMPVVNAASPKITQATQPCE